MSSDDDPEALAALGRRAIQSLADCPDLPYRDPEILASYLRDGFNYKEIGEALSVSRTTIRNWVIEHELEHLHPDRPEGEGPADRD